jgi:hypothetical protein
LPLLLYCISEIEPEIPPPAQGLRGYAVERRVMAGTACYFSELRDTKLKLTKEDALVFAKVIATVFARTAVIPFRFPTVMEGIGELEVYLETEAHDLLESLQRLRDFVQMEVRFTHEVPGEAKESGKQYLQGRHRAKQMVEHVADSAHESFGDLVTAWHTRDVATGLRCYALVARGNVGEFRKKGEQMKFSGEVHIGVTGPWPPTEFLSDPDAEL